MQIVSAVDATYELIGQKEHGLERELAVAEVEQILQGGTEKIDDHGVVVTLGAKPADEGDSHTPGEGLVDLGLILELRVLSLDRLEFDGNLLARDDVDAQVNIAYREGSAKRALPEYMCHSPKDPEPIFFPNLYLPPTRKSSL